MNQDSRYSRTASAFAAAFVALACSAQVPIVQTVYAADVPGTQPEQIAYATAEKITGPWTDRGLMTGPAKVGFTIHPSVIEFKGQWCLFYHDGSTALNGIPGGDCRRSVCLDYLHVNSDGTIRPITQTREGVSSPPAR